MDYLHGTGHGVGAFLNVHEGMINVGMYPAYIIVGEVSQKCLKTRICAVC